VFLGVVVLICKMLVNHPLSRFLARYYYHIYFWYYQGNENMLAWSRQCLKTIKKNVTIIIYDISFIQVAANGSSNDVLDFLHYCLRICKIVLTWHFSTQFPPVCFSLVFYCVESTPLNLLSLLISSFQLLYF